MNVLDGLNPEQHQAVLHGDGPLLVVAGAGSGKTRVLTVRIAHLVNDRGVDPRSILAITFTNKAAREMKTRLADLLGDAMEGMWVSTFHSACLRILRAHGERVGLRPGFTIYDEDDALKLLAIAAIDEGLDPKAISMKATHAMISSAKAALISPAKMSPMVTTAMESARLRVYDAYQKALLAHNAVDFDDILVKTVGLFRTCPDVLAHYQAKFHHVLVDEYQDTNVAQNEIVRLLGECHRNVCVVGDVDQAIYRFRGAEIANILTFEKMFPGTHTVVLDRNYRSTAHILGAANGVIGHNTERPEKHLRTDKTGGSRVLRYDAASGIAEMEWLAGRVADLLHSGTPGGDIAVLCRQKAIGRDAEAALIAANIACRFVGAVSFYDRKYIKDIIGYLRFVSNPDDEIAFRRIVNTPRRAVGDASVAKLQRWARHHAASFNDAMARSDEVREMPPRAAKGLAELAALMDKARSLADGGSSAGDVLAFVVESIGYRQHLTDDDEEATEARLAGLDLLLRVAATHASVGSFLDAAGLASADDDSTADRRVVIMTVHGAKGLEFPVVFVPAMEEGIFPDSRSLDSPKDVEEERRLAYVAITRAKQRLFLSHAHQRVRYGQTEYNEPSRFLDEIPEHFVDILA
jgi:DNA helicase-2/ATP-dependent DNA helicase PcrA